MLQSNANLLLVTGVGAGESFDGPTGAGPEKWAGVEPIYVRERRNRQREGSTGNVVMDRVLIVDADVAVDWRVGDSVQYSRDGGSFAGSVALVERATIDDPDIPPELQTVRLTLEAA